MKNKKRTTFKQILQSIHSCYRYMKYDGEHRCHFHFIGNYKYFIWDRPGLWASDKELEEIRNSLITICQEAQGQKEIPMYGPLLPGRENYKDKLITIAYNKDTDLPSGFSAQTHLKLTNGKNPIHITHLGLFYISPKAQKSGIASILSVLPNLICYIRSGFRPIWVTSVSQVPAVVGLFSKNYANVYPSTDQDSTQTAEHYLITKEVMRSHRHVFGVGEEAGYIAEEQIITNAYTGGSDNLKKSFDSAPKHRDEKVNELCRNKLDYARGDDFLQLGKMNTDVLWSFVHSKVCQNIFSKLAITCLQTSLRAILIPYARIFFPTQKPGKINIQTWKIKG